MIIKTQYLRHVKLRYDNPIVIGPNDKAHWAKPATW